MPPKPMSKKAKQAAAAAAMAAAASTPTPDESADNGTPDAGDAADTPTAADAAGIPDASTISLQSARGDDSSTVGTSATKESSLEAFLADAKPGEDLHWRLMNQAMDMINITTSTYQSKVHPNSKDIALSNVSLILKGRELVVDANIMLNWGQRYGLLGPNGCGKSLLLSVIGRRLLPLPANLDVYLLMSEIEASDMTALEAVMTVDAEREKVEAAIEQAEALLTGEDDPEQELINARLVEMYERLDDLDVSKAEARAGKILHGLGFTKETMAKKTREFSGGWRMRIALARALFVHPDLLLLDEPTNHLDLEAVVWLSSYLQTYRGTLLLVSHSQTFMNDVCTSIIRMHKKQLTFYGGNFDTYVSTRAASEVAQMVQYEKQQAEIAMIKDFIRRYANGTPKQAAQAQSREKQLKKMIEEGLIQKVEKDSVIAMSFPDPGLMPPPVLQLTDVSFGYPGCKLLYKDLNFGLDLDSRITLVGPNGQGKTTLLKLLCGELIPTKGAVQQHPHLRLARYTQHAVDCLDITMDPLEFFCKSFPKTPLEEMRSKLGRFGISGEYQTTKIAYLSDGIKSRAIFALMAMRTPHVLLLDEPTNALDIETIDALAKAVQEFKGGVVLVSHDIRLISQITKDIYECEGGIVKKFPGDIREYGAVLAKKMEEAQREFEKQEAAKAAAGAKS